MALFEVSDLVVQVYQGNAWRNAVHGVDFSVGMGEALALVGESGSGKSLMAVGAVDLLRPSARVKSGTTTFEGRQLQKMSDVEWRQLVGMGVGVLFQDPIGAWDPTAMLGFQSGEVLEEHTALTREEIEQRVVDALGEVRLPKKQRFFGSFAHELSRGEAQRAMLAAALLSNPRLLIADEPLSGLDPTVARAVMGIIDDLRRKRGMGMVLVTHDLGVVAAVADRVAVVYGGRIVELGPVDDVFHRPRHPYTAGLLASLPALGRRLKPIEGDPPEITDVPDGCAFAERCRYVRAGCQEGVPPFTLIDDTSVRCIRAGELELSGVS